ncbi:hypothetical protein ABK040_008335 [Willaertia magna]
MSNANNMIKNNHQNHPQLEQQLEKLKEELTQAQFLDESLQASFKKNIYKQMNEIKKQLKHLQKTNEIVSMKENNEYEVNVELNTKLGISQLNNLLYGKVISYSKKNITIPTTTLKLLNLLDINNNCYYYIKTTDIINVNSQTSPIAIFHKFMKNYVLMNLKTNEIIYCNHLNENLNENLNGEKDLIICVTPKKEPFFEVKLTVGCAYKKIEDYKTCLTENELNLINKIKINKNIYNYTIYESQLENEDNLFYLNKSTNEFLFNLNCDKISDAISDKIFYWDEEFTMLDHFDIIVKGSITKIIDKNYGDEKVFCGKLFLLKVDCDKHLDIIPNLAMIKEGTEFELGTITFKLKE